MHLLTHTLYSPAVSGLQEEQTGLPIGRKEKGADTPLIGMMGQVKGNKSALE